MPPAALIADFSRAHPGVSVTVRAGVALPLLGQLRDGGLDLVLALVDPDLLDGLEGVRLFEEELVVMVPEGHRLARRRSARIADLADERLVSFLAGSALRQRLDLELERAGALKTPELESNHINTLRALVAHGLGVSLVPRSFALAEGPPVAMLKLAPRKLKVPVSILYRADRARPPAAEAFLESVRARF
jgi:DNA-binding transcriptional LysR family regulator